MFWTMAKEFRPQDVRSRGKTHRSPGMTRVRCLNGIERKHPYRIDRIQFKVIIWTFCFTHHHTPLFIIQNIDRLLGITEEAF
jgi:hypothetical protein